MNIDEIAALVFAAKHTNLWLLGLQAQAQRVADQTGGSPEPLPPNMQALALVLPALIAKLERGLGVVYPPSVPDSDSV